MKKYYIKKGKHNSGLHFKPFFEDQISFDAIFSESCLYNFYNIDQLDINKLMGFSRGFHHKNSARIGWRSKDDSIELVTYCYVDGLRIDEEILQTVKPGELFSCLIKDIGKTWVFQVETDKKISKVYVKKEQTSCFGYMLFPYFGGNNVAPHNMNISIELKK